MELIKNTKELVLVKIKFDNELDKMNHRGFNGSERFVRCTKGKCHTMTVFGDKQKVLSSFEFGEGGTTLISDELKQLQRKVIDFVISQRINIRNQRDKKETSFKTMPGHFYNNDNLLTVHLGGEYAGFYRKKDIHEMLEPFRYVSKENYNKLEYRLTIH